jgi:hypothetical protein
MIKEITVEIDFDDLNTQDMLDEIEDRMMYNDYDRDIILEWLKHIEIDRTGFSTIDEMKLDFFLENIDKISQDDLETITK